MLLWKYHDRSLWKQPLQTDRYARTMEFSVFLRLWQLNSPDYALAVSIDRREE